MKIYTTFSPSHKILYNNYFLKSLPKSFELVVYEEDKQPCKSGVYNSFGWTLATKKKIDIFYNACLENFGKYFFYCDVDVNFFTSDVENILLQEIDDYDIACQDDILSYCSGVFICMCNDRTLNMFKIMKDNYDYSIDDQKILNKYIHLCRSKKLSKKFFTTGFVMRMWKDIPFDIPKDIVLHHANWVVGIDQKRKVLDIVKQKYYNG